MWQIPKISHVIQFKDSVKQSNEDNVLYVFMICIQLLLSLLLLIVRRFKEMSSFFRRRLYISVTLSIVPVRARQRAVVFFCNLYVYYKYRYKFHVVNCFCKSETESCFLQLQICDKLSVLKIKMY